MAGEDGKADGRRDASNASNRHAAFISYSQGDKAEVKKLQHWLETYRVPKSLRTGAVRSDGKLGRIFRDDEDMSAVSDIGGQVRAAIENSDALVVACSPRAAKSKWVEAEIQHFRKTGREGKIFAVILDGEPNSPDPERECFPPSFRRGGVVGDQSMMPIEPLALDMKKDGRERVRARLAAGLLGVGFDDIWNRERRRQRTRATLTGGLLATGVALTATAGVATWLALDNNAKAETARMEAERSAEQARTAQSSAAQAQRAADSAATLANENLARAADERSATFASEADKLLEAGRFPGAMLMSLYGDPAAAKQDEAVRALRPDGLVAARNVLSRAFLHKPLLTVPYLRGITNAAFSPDGSRIVTASIDGTATIWRARTGESLRVLQVHPRDVSSAIFSPDGTRLLTSSTDGTARIWDAETGTPVRTLSGHTGLVISAEFSPDGTRIVTASAGDDDTARIWDARTGATIEILSEHSRDVNSAAFSRDGTRIVTASSDGTARIWDAATGKRLTIVSEPSKYIASAAFSPDGKRIVTASWNSDRADASVRIWDSETGEALRTLSGHLDAVYRANFSPNGARIVTASKDGTAVIWDARDGRRLATLAGHSGSVMNAAFSMNELSIVTASFDDAARIWDAGPMFDNAQPNEQVRLACARLNELGVYDFAPEERAKLTILKDEPPYPCGAPPPGVPAWPEGGPEY